MLLYEFLYRQNVMNFFVQHTKQSLSKLYSDRNYGIAKIKKKLNYLRWTIFFSQK